MKVAISGFGRIGRDVTRILMQKNDPDLELVALNITSDLKTNAHLLKFDSIYRTFKKEVEVIADDKIKIGGKEIKVVNSRNPEELPWKELGVDLVIDSTGAFKDKEGLSKHLKAGAKKVLLTAPGKSDVKMIVVGVNDKEYNPETDDIVSNASCTTNCLAPVAKVLDDEFGIEKGLMTTIHAYTNDQNIQDAHHKDLRRARAAALSMIPTTTGAAKAVGKVLPQLEGKMTGLAVRELKGILGYSEDQLVSSDIIGDERSSIFDADMTYALGNMVKIASWYDNEWGYSSRVFDLAKIIATR